MLTNLPFLLTAACALPLAAAACGGDGSETVIPEGTHHGYVVSKASVVPAAGHTIAEFSLDLGSKMDAKLDGKPENALGAALMFLSGLNPMLNVQTTVDASVNQGTIILLLDFQAKDFMNSNAGFGVKFGANPNPAPCSTPTDCGHHLTGTGSFSVATNSPKDELLGGKLANGAFNGGPGELSLQIAIGTTDPILLPLVHARAKVTSVSATGLSAIVGGLLTVADLKANVGGALQVSVTALVAGGCTDLIHPPECGCTGLAQQVMMLTDGSTGTAPDCKISVDELLGNAAIGPMLTPDACSTDKCTAPDALSVGIKVDAVAATFPM